jgi:glycosyltransferase involved in cell wall biosynthesis
MDNVRVLVINTLGLHFEGITSVIYSYINAMNRDGLDISFIAFDDIDEELNSKFSKLGTIYFVEERKKNLKQYIKDLNHVLSNGFDVVHIHGNSATMAIEARIAKKHGVKKVIAHCHNSTCSHPKLFGPKSILGKIMYKYTDKKIACSSLAGEWLFGKDFTVLNNAIDLKKFSYNIETRNELRNEFNIANDDIVIGHVGLFSEQKNHSFLIDVFNAFYNLNKRAKLLLLSDGPRFEDIKEKVNLLGLSENVIFAGRRSDVNRIYNAMDIFVFPSKWEGLGIVNIEAQANGLPILASTDVPEIAKCTDLMSFKPLSDGSEMWAQEIEKILNLDLEREKDYTEEIVFCGYDIRTEADKLREIYLEI